MKRKLNPKERLEVVKNQAEVVLKFINDNQDKAPKELAENILAIQFAEGRSLKPDAIKITIDLINREFQGDKEKLKKISSALNIVLDTRNVGKNKKSQNFAVYGNKGEGLTDGAILKKSGKDKKIMAKNAPDFEGLKGGEVCEYISTNIANIFMPGNTPKFRLHVGDGETTPKVASTFISKFQTVYDYFDSKLLDYNPQHLKGTKGLATLAGTAYLTGHYDFHGGNVGVRKNERGEKEFALIDFGRGLSYNREDRFKINGTIETLKSPQTIDRFIDNMKRGGNAYCDERSFKGAVFACELANFAASIDSERVKNVVKLSIINLTAAYGDNFLDDSEISKELKKRMQITESPITEAILTNKITENIKNCKEQLQQKASEELALAKNEAEKNKDYETLGYIALNDSANEVVQKKALENYKKVTEELIKQRSYLQKAKIYFGFNKLNEEKLTKNEVKKAKISVAQSLKNHSENTIDTNNTGPSAKRSLSCDQSL